MRTRNIIQILTVAIGLATGMQAGPAIACHWVAVPGTVFASLSELRDRAVQADDSPTQGEAALAELKRLRAAAKPDVTSAPMRLPPLPARVERPGLHRDGRGARIARRDDL